jgi:hypothetical protein
MKPLVLTDAQMKLIRESAKHVPVEYRSLYLNLVVDFLEGDGGEVCDGRIVEAIGLTLSRLHVAAPEPPCAGDRV